jgi:hypothetical protein
MGCPPRRRSRTGCPCRRFAVIELEKDLRHDHQPGECKYWTTFGEERIYFQVDRMGLGISRDASDIMDSRNLPALETLFFHPYGSLVTLYP